MSVIQIMDKDQIKDKDLKFKSYKKFEDAVEKIGLVDWVKKNIQDNPNKIVIGKISDFAKELGPEFVNYNPASIYSALKVVLFQKGLFVEMRTHKEGDKLLTIRYKTNADKIGKSFYTRVGIGKEEKRREGETLAEDVASPITKYEKLIDQEWSGLEKARKELKKQKDQLYEEIRKHRNALEDAFKKEKKVYLEEIKKLKDELKSKKEEKKTYMVEVFQFNWKTLNWKMIRGKTIKTGESLEDILNKFTSTPENRIRIEITDVIHFSEETNGEKVDVGEEEPKSKVSDPIVESKIDGVVNPLKIDEVVNPIEQLVEKDNL